jgi:hypothetical protein
VYHRITRSFRTRNRMSTSGSSSPSHPVCPEPVPDLVKANALLKMVGMQAVMSSCFLTSLHCHSSVLVSTRCQYRPLVPHCFRGLLCAVTRVFQAGVGRPQAANAECGGRGARSGGDTIGSSSSKFKGRLHSAVALADAGFGRGVVDVADGCPSGTSPLATIDVSSTLSTAAYDDDSGDGSTLSPYTPTLPPTPELFFRSKRTQTCRHSMVAARFIHFSCGRDAGASSLREKL